MQRHEAKEIAQTLIADLRAGKIPAVNRDQIVEYLSNNLPTLTDDERESAVAEICRAVVNLAV